MIYEGLLYGVGFVLAFVVLYGLSWVVLGPCGCALGMIAPSWRSCATCAHDGGIGTIVPSFIVAR